MPTIQLSPYYGLGHVSGIMMEHDGTIVFRDNLKAGISNTLLGPYGMEWTWKTFDPLYKQPSNDPKLREDSGQAQKIVSSKI
jgi:hypothetical protein